jgi:hypothetical protein
VRSVKESAEQLDEGDVVLQRISQALSDAESDAAAKLGDSVRLPGSEGLATVIDVVDGMAKLRDAGGKITELPLDQLRRVATVDLGMGPMPLDQRIAVGLTEDGQPRYMTVREIISELNEDEAMVRAMTTCARA